MTYYSRHAPYSDGKHDHPCFGKNLVKAPFEWSRNEKVLKRSQKVKKEKPSTIKSVAGADNNQRSAVMVWDPKTNKMQEIIDIS